MHGNNLILFVFLIIAISPFACQKEIDYAITSDFFATAIPIWPENRQFEKNLTIGFLSKFETPDNEGVFLKVTGASLYRIYVNGQFAGHGPARAGHGYFRVDSIKLDEFLNTGINYLAIEVASYNVNSYYLLDQPGFLQAEVTTGNKVLVATSDRKSDFKAYHLNGRIQKSPRYSFQRPFTECYNLSPDYNNWRMGVDKSMIHLICEQTANKNLIARRLPYSKFSIQHPVSLLSTGKVKTGLKRDNYWKDRAVVNIGEKLGGFKETELTYNPAIQLQEIVNESLLIEDMEFQKSIPSELVNNQFNIYDLGTNLTGFIGTEIEITDTGRFILTFDEILTDDDVDFKRLGCINAVVYDLVPGKYKFESFEPYTFRYLKIMSIEGNAKIHDIYLREYTNPDIDLAHFNCSDDRLNRIFTAGIETFRQNAVDVFMDCPSRERAGWLCDSYFASRVAQDISGHALIEKNFFENYLLPDTFEFIPEGMLPMCYPADHNDGVFIPNWAMWFVLQLQEYYERTQDKELVEALEPKVIKLFDYFTSFKNEDGLLEDLDSWIFVEWSAANQFVKDVNYPTNMLYASSLEAAGQLYKVDSFLQQSKNVRNTIQQQAFNGEFFSDNAIRNQANKLEVTENTTEVCQYYAFFFDVATPTSHPELWQKLTSEFGPNRIKDNPYPNVHFANSFVGNYLRLELLSRYNLQSQLLRESIDFFDYMAVRTGTLWENQSPSASCNHGFASHIVHVLYRDVLGINAIDFLNNTITIQFSDLDLNKCNGQIPIGNELIKVKWSKEDTKIIYKINIPDRYELIIENKSRLTLIESD